MSEAHFVVRVAHLLRALDDSETRALDNGTLLIGQLKHRQPLDPLYLHTFFGPLSSQEIARLEVRIERKLPEPLRDLYRHCNGGDLFCCSFGWNGLRDDYSRDPEKWLPIGLEHGNTIDRPLEGPPGQERYADNSDQVRFGIYVGAAAEVMMRLDGDPKVYAVPRYKLGPVLYEWPDLEAFFASEVDRMIALYRARNGVIGAANPLPPPWLDPDAQR